MTAYRWTPWPKAHHEEALELLRAGNGGELPAWAIQADLVYLCDLHSHRGTPLPGRRALRRRWGCTERQARAALRSERWRATAESCGIAVPARVVPVGVPRASPSASPSASPPRTGKPSQSDGSVPVDVPVDVPRASPSASTRADPYDPNDPTIPIEYGGSRARDPEVAVGMLVEDPEALRSAVADPHASALADVLGHMQRADPLAALSPDDIQAIRGALKVGHTVQDLVDVWDFFRLAPSTDYARDSGWSHRWSALGNRKFPGRVRDARRWVSQGRPTTPTASPTTGGQLSPMELIRRVAAKEKP